MKIEINTDDLKQEIIHKVKVSEPPVKEEDVRVIQRHILLIKLDKIRKDLYESSTHKILSNSTLGYDDTKVSKKLVSQIPDQYNEETFIKELFTILFPELTDITSTDVLRIELLTRIRDILHGWIKNIERGE